MDNGKTFTAKVVEAIVDQQDVKLNLSQIGVEWCFNLEKALWWLWEIDQVCKEMPEKNDRSSKVYLW